ncbi:MAG: serine/threonine protein kinase, partial [Thermoleophilia bacterium]|nr:serine/threonine protein kinase [Thermoleophilia bacterium]
IRDDAGLEPLLEDASAAHAASNVFTLTLESAAGDGGATVRQEKRGPATDPTQDPFLRARLRAATAFFAIVLSAILAWIAFAVDGPTVAAQGGLVVVLVLMYGYLAGERPISATRLRVLEVVVFGAVAAFLGLRQYQAMRAWAALGDPTLVLLSVKTSLVATVLLIFAYCMFIPNTWRSAARVVPLLALAPAVTEGLLYLTHPEALVTVWKVATPWRVVEDVGLVVVASVLAVYGSHVIETLRHEARAARELNQYRLVQRLGWGGMGEVYLAEHQLLKRPCAVKLIRHDSAADPIELRRFEREVRATARLSHPNTVEVYDYGRTDEGTFYYVMEYLRGLSLEEIVRRHGPMPPGRVIYLLRQVCGALAEAHEAGLVHRDVKPANIFASVRGGRRDVAKLLDFGLVKGPALGVSGEPTDARREGMIRGTPLYMAPEQVVADADVDLRCDIYAL